MRSRWSDSETEASFGFFLSFVCLDDGRMELGFFFSYFSRAVKPVTLKKVNPNGLLTSRCTSENKWYQSEGAKNQDFDRQQARWQAGQVCRYAQPCRMVFSGWSSKKIDESFLKLQPRLSRRRVDFIKSQGGRRADRRTDRWFLRSLSAPKKRAGQQR